MNDITNISVLISGMRNATQANSVSTEVVGSLLQKLADMLKKTTTDAEFGTIKDWTYAVMAEAGYLLKNITIDTSDPSAVNLNLSFLSLSDLLTDAYPITIPAASQTSAGVMSAEQCVKLDNAATETVNLWGMTTNLEGEIALLSDNLTSIRSQIGMNFDDLTARTITLEDIVMPLEQNVTSLQETVNGIYDTKPWLEDRQLHAIDGVVDSVDELSAEGSSFAPGTYYVRSAHSFQDLGTDGTIVLNAMFNVSLHGEVHPRRDLYYVINGRFAAVDNTGQLVASTSSPI